MIKANLIHLGLNLWEDKVCPEEHRKDPDRMKRAFSPDLRFDEGLFNKVIEDMSNAGMNMVILDLADGVKYKSHPEIAINGAWSVEKLKEAIQKCRNLGLEPIPKMNFSSSHDIWLKEYSRMLSTKKYYEVCEDLINEAVEIFDGPRFFHIGMDEETYMIQRTYEYIVVRNGALWWDDLCRLFDVVNNNGCRSWMWSDVIWSSGKELFGKHVPRDVMQSNWYYYDQFMLNPENEPHYTYLKGFLELEELGYEQIPTASVWSNLDNYPNLVDFCSKYISEDKLKGFMMSTWWGMTPENEKLQLDAVEIVRKTHSR
jgi:hypothetical protein